MMTEKERHIITEKEFVSRMTKYVKLMAKDLYAEGPTANRAFQLFTGCPTKAAFLIMNGDKE